MKCEEFWSNEGRPDPTDESVAKRNQLCKCDAMAMPHKRNAFCDILEAQLEFHLGNGAKIAARKPSKGFEASKLFKRLRSKRGVCQNRCR